MSKKEYQLRLKKFSFDMMSPTSTVAMIGSRGQGKSFCMRDLLYHFTNIPIGTLISPTEEMNGGFGDHVPKMFIHDKYTDDLMEKVLKRQKLLITKIKNDPEFANVDPHAWLMLDDCMYDTNWQKSESIRNVFFNGRHYKLLVVLALQDCLGLQLNFRNNTDWAFIFRTNNAINRTRLYKYFCSMFPKESVFAQVLNQVTADYGCLVVHMTSKSDNLTDQVFWYKADVHNERWRTCLDYFWEQAEQEDQDDEPEAGDDFNQQIFGAGRNGIQVNVRKIAN